LTDTKLINEDFTTGFNYILKDEKMILKFYCDCCNKEVKVEETINKVPTKKQDKNDLFMSLKQQMDSKFHRCEYCNFLVCEECWSQKDIKCAECPICLDKVGLV
jgi:hypothetical protein